MTLYQEHELICMVTAIFKNLSDLPAGVLQEPGDGLKLIGCDWLTPSQCYLLRTIIEEHNNHYYGDWTLDRDFFDRLKIAEHSA